MARLALAGIARLPAEDRDATLTNVPRESLDVIETTGRLSWVPLEHQLAINTAALDHLGPRRFEEMWRDVSRRSTQEALFSSFVSGLLRVCGASPLLLLKIIPRAIHQVARDVGSYEVLPSQQAGQAQIVHYDIPPLLRDDETWARVMGTSLHVPMDLLAIPGEVQMHRTQSTGRIEYDIRWSVGAARASG